MHKFFISFILILAVAMPLFVSAQILTGPIVPCGLSADDGSTPYNETQDCNLCHLFLGVKNIINFLTFNIGLPLVVIALIIGGILMLTSGGSEEKVRKGKSAVSSGIIGLIIIFAAWLIIDLVLGNLVNTGYFPWDVFPDPSNCTWSI